MADDKIFYYYTYYNIGFDVTMSAQILIYANVNKIAYRRINININIKKKKKTSYVALSVLRLRRV